MTRPTAALPTLVPDLNIAARNGLQGSSGGKMLFARNLVVSSNDIQLSKIRKLPTNTILKPVLGRNFLACLVPCWRHFAFLSIFAAGIVLDRHEQNRGES